MEFKQGELVKYKNTNKIVGYVIGMYNPLEYRDIWTVVVPDEYASNWPRRWEWRRHERTASPVYDLCVGKYCWNFFDYDLKSARTKLGNML